jgi:serine/threonine-protein kinase RsbT
VIRSDVDIVVARRRGRELATAAGFAAVDATLIATAISELARNIVEHTSGGEMLLELVERDGCTGLRIVAQDQGPGIPDVELALQDGYSSRRSLGLGLPGARRLLDEFALTSAPGCGTTVEGVKWLR